MPAVGSMPVSTPGWAIPSTTWPGRFSRKSGTGWTPMPGSTRTIPGWPRRGVSCTSPKAPTGSGGSAASTTPAWTTSGTTSSGCICRTSTRCWTPSHRARSSIPSWRGGPRRSGGYHRGPSRRPDQSTRPGSRRDATRSAAGSGRCTSLPSWSRGSSMAATRSGSTSVSTAPSRPPSWERRAPSSGSTSLAVRPETRSASRWPHRFDPRPSTSWPSSRERPSGSPATMSPSSAWRRAAPGPCLWRGSPRPTHSVSRCPSPLSTRAPASPCSWPLWRCAMVRTSSTSLPWEP